MKEKPKSNKTDELRRQREEEHLRREAERKRVKVDDKPREPIPKVGPNR